MNAKSVAYKPFDRVCRLHHQLPKTIPKTAAITTISIAAIGKRMRVATMMVLCRIRDQELDWVFGSTAVNEIRCADIRIITVTRQMKLKKRSRFVRPSPQFSGDARVSTSLFQALPTPSVSAIQTCNMMLASSGIGATIPATSAESSMSKIPAGRCIYLLPVRFQVSGFRQSGSQRECVETAVIGLII